MYAAPTNQAGECQRVVVKTAAGKEYDLGKPSSPLFRLRVLLYRLRRKLRG